MRECVAEGLLQSYFDGELSREQARSVAAHLASCLTCTEAARELEREAVLLSQALEAEFAGSVPTEKLRHKVDAAIAGLHLVNPERRGVVAQAGGTPAVPVGRSWWPSFAELFRVSPQRGYAYAGLAAIVLFAALFAWIQFRGGVPSTIVSEKNPLPTRTTAAEKPHEEVVANQSSGTADRDVIVPVSHQSKRRRPVALNHQVKLLPGERSYLKTIATLDTTIKSDNVSPRMKPATQVEYERNLALVDRAIAATRNAAKNNPSDPDAAEFMFSAYQSKVDLLNQVADSRLSNRPRP